MASVTFPKTLRAITQDYQEFQTPIGSNCEAIIREFSTIVPGGNVWTSTGSLNTARDSFGSGIGVGTASASLVAGGYNGSASLSSAERFNSSTWSAMASIGETKNAHFQCGIQNAALVSSGWNVADFGSRNNTYLFNGNSWATSGAVPSLRVGSSALGKMSAARAAGSTGNTTTIVFNGSSWSSGPNTTVVRVSPSGFGLSGSGMFATGANQSSTAMLTNTDVFNGSVFSVGPNVIAGVLAASACGSLSNGLLISGDTAPSGVGAGLVTTCQRYFGGAFSIIGGLSQARYAACSGGTPSAAIVAAGGLASGGRTASTERLFSTVSVQTSLFSIGSRSKSENTGSNFGGGLVVSQQSLSPSLESVELAEVQDLDRNTLFAFSVSGNLVAARTQLGYSGTRDAGLSVGGNSSGTAGMTNSERFNGSTWASSASLSLAAYGIGAAGLQNGAIKFGGQHSGALRNQTELFDGSAWSTGANMNVARHTLGGTGAQQAALSVGGFSTVYETRVEKYNGSSWSNTVGLSVAKSGISVSGSQNSALSIGGSTGINSSSVERFDGTTWTTVASLPTATNLGASSGGVSSSLFTGGFQSSYSALAYSFNGTTWSSTVAMNTSRSGLTGGGSSVGATFCGGFTGANSAVTEKYQSIARPVAFYNAMIESTLPLA